MNTFYFLEANGKIILYVTSGIGIMSQLSVIVKAVLIGRNAQTQMPFQSFFFPMLVPFFLRSGTNKKLHFHLLKLSHSKDKLPRNNFISKRFSYLCNTKW